MLSNKRIDDMKYHDHCVYTSNWRFGENKRGDIIVKGFNTHSSLYDPGTEFQSKKIKEFYITDDGLYALHGDYIYECLFKNHSEDLRDLYVYLPDLKRAFKSLPVSAEEMLEKIKREIEIVKEEKVNAFKNTIPSDAENAVIFSVKYDMQNYADIFLVKESDEITLNEYKVKNNYVYAEHNDMHVSYIAREFLAPHRYFNLPNDMQIHIDNWHVPSNTAVFFYNSGVFDISIMLGPQKVKLSNGDFARFA